MASNRCNLTISRAEQCRSNVGVAWSFVPMRAASPIGQSVFTETDVTASETLVIAWAKLLQHKPKSSSHYKRQCVRGDKLHTR
jgi:hypothetical protein